MSDDKHKSELLETISDQIDIIDMLPLHPKNKLKLYQQWTLLEISWHLTVIKISNTWMKNNIDNIVSWYIRLWLEIPVNGALNIVTHSKRKLGLGATLPSTRHTQCQVTFRNKLRKCSSHNIWEIHKSTKNINIQYDHFNSICEALKHICSSDVSCIMEKLTTQSIVVKSIWEFVDGRSINQWSNVISHLPRNIFSFTNRYLNNTLANGTNAIKWWYNQQLYLRILWPTTNPWSCHWWMRNCIARIKVQLASWLSSIEHLQNYQITSVASFCWYRLPESINHYWQWATTRFRYC